MNLYKEYRIKLDIPVEDAQLVLRKITDSKTRVIRTNYDSIPFTGKVTKDKFLLKPNVVRNVIHLKGIVEYDNPTSSVLVIKGGFRIARLIGNVFILSILSMIFAFILTMFFQDEGIVAILPLFTAIFLLVNGIFFTFQLPANLYRSSVYAIMRKMDNHDVI